MLKVEVDQAGDFSLYTLRLVTDASDDAVPAGIDPQLAAVQFSFKVECPSPFDCAPQPVCPPAPMAVPDIDYLAKDYASFRRLMLDRMAVLMPAWKERNPADIGVMLVEALAYSADQLSYQQDAVATEAYLRTARKRISLRRHARLMDYFISEGCNARAWVHLQVSADVIGVGPNDPALPAGSKITTQIARQEIIIADDPRVYEQAEVIFETLEPVQFLYVAHNEIEFYTWSDERCCLTKGATAASLKDDTPEGRLLLRPGDILIFEEVVGPQTGVEADANPAHRHAVRLSRVFPKADPVLAKNKNGEDVEIGRTPVSCPWIPSPAKLSLRSSGAKKTRCRSRSVCPRRRATVTTPSVSVARGNIVLADHGLTFQDESLGAVPEPFLFMPLASGGDSCAPPEPQPIFPRFRPRLANRR